MVIPTAVVFRTPRVAVVIIAMAVTTALVPMPAAWVEHVYSRQVYLTIQRLVTSLSSFVGFSLFDPLVAVVVGGLGLWWWCALRHASTGGRSRVLVLMLLNTGAFGAVLYLSFLIAWGLNYRREPLTAKLDYDPASVSVASLSVLSEETVDYLNGLYPTVDGKQWPAFIDLPGRFGRAFDEAQRRLGVERTAVAGRPKTTLLLPYFERAGIDGMLNPFLLEVLVNDTVMPYERPFLVAHEWAHLAGYANEAEASYVGFLVCLAGDVQSQYSAWLFLLPQLVRHLPDSERSAVYARLSEGPREHLKQISERLNRVVPLVRRNANRVYDRFLRANRVNEGIASYGLVVDLMLGTKDSPTWRGLIDGDGMISPARGER